MIHPSKIIVTIAMVCALALAEAAHGQSMFLEGATQPQLAADGERAYIAVVRDGTIQVGTVPVLGEGNRLPDDVAAPSKLMAGMRRGPRIAVAGEAVVVTAIAGEPAELLSWRSTDGGETWKQTANSIAGEPGAVREGLHDLAGNADGKLAVVWLDMRDADENGTELWMAESNDAGTTWGTPRRIYHNPGGTICECCHPSVTYDTNGKPVVLFRNSLDGNRDMYLWRDGKAEKLGTGTWPLNGCPMAGGDLAAYINPMNNREVVETVWRREGTIYSATPGGDEGVIADGRQPVLAVSNAGWPVVFYTGAEGLLAYLPLEGTFLIDAEGGSYPAAVVLPGSVVVAYQNRRGVEVYEIERFEQYEMISR